MNVGFTGSRNYPRTDLVTAHIIALAGKYPDATVTSGGRGNVDTTAENAALELGLDVMSYRPTDRGIEVWGSINGKLVKISDIVTDGGDFVLNCFRRNDYIAQCDRVVGFWDLRSRGTADTLSKAKGHGKQRFVWDAAGVLLPEDVLDGHVHKVLG